jgi:hypothetical protein
VVSVYWWLLASSVPIFFFGVSSAICGGQEHFRLILCCVFGVSPVICGGQENFRRSGEVILWFWFGAVSVEESFW